MDKKNAPLEQASEIVNQLREISEPILEIADYAGLLRSTKYFNKWVKLLKGRQILILGERASGKTTLFRRILGVPINLTESPEATRAGGEHLRTKILKMPDYDAIRLRNIDDRGGEVAIQEYEWVEDFKKKKPDGILIVLDPQQPVQSKQAWSFVLTMIQKEEKGLFKRDHYGKARKKLQTIYVLFNKYDSWHDSLSFDTLVMQTYYTELHGLEKVCDEYDITYGIRPCSAKYGFGVKEAISDFFLDLVK